MSSSDDRQDGTWFSVAHLYFTKPLHWFSLRFIVSAVHSGQRQRRTELTSGHRRYWEPENAETLRRNGKESGSGLNPGGKKQTWGRLEMKSYTADNQLKQFHPPPPLPSYTIKPGLCWNPGQVKEEAVLAPAPAPLDSTLALRGHFPSNPCTPTLKRVHVTHG